MLRRRVVLIATILTVSALVALELTASHRSATLAAPAEPGSILEPAVPLGVGGALSNWDVYNNCFASFDDACARDLVGDCQEPSPAISFTWTLTGVNASEVVETYAGEHAFGDGAVGGIPEPSDPRHPYGPVEIRWENPAMPVAAGEKAHFGFSLSDALGIEKPNAINTSWGLANGETCELPPALLQWYGVRNAGEAVAEGQDQTSQVFEVRITNTGSDDVKIQRRSKNLQQAGFGLTDLTSDSSLIDDADWVDTQSKVVSPGDHLTYEFTEQSNDTGLLMIYSVKSLAGELQYVAYQALKLPLPMPTATPETPPPTATITASPTHAASATMAPSTTPTSAVPTPSPTAEAAHYMLFLPCLGRAIAE